MARVKRGVTAGRRHKKVLGKAKGYYNARRKVYRAAKQAVIKAGQYAYRDRRQNKREFRALWITRINAAARLYGLSYSRIINGLNRAGVEIDRKVLADIAVHDTAAFGAIAQQAKRDRKSTRLNSSHGYISYAVFCLKKKKTSDQRRRSRAGRTTGGTGCTTAARTRGERASTVERCYAVAMAASLDGATTATCPSAPP